MATTTLKRVSPDPSTAGGRKEKAPSPRKKRTMLIGYVRDHSASMTHYGLTQGAMDDFNHDVTLWSTQTDALDVYASVVECHPTIRIPQVHTSIARVAPMTRYVADGGGTPLYESVLKLIEVIEPHAHKEDVSVLINIITDGQNNRGENLIVHLRRKIMELQATDRWTIAFRVPRGYKQALVDRLGIYEGNIVEWETSGAGMADVARTQEVATRSFAQNVATGKARSSQSFYTTSMINAKPSALKRAGAVDISSKIKVLNVREPATIRPFVEDRTGQPYEKGTAFYLLDKPEKAVQDYKLICIKHRKSGMTYGGRAARSILGLPEYGTIKLAPGDNGGFDIFVQSTSVNRKLPAGTKLLIWDKPQA